MSLLKLMAVSPSSTINGRGLAVAGILGAAVLAAVLLIPGMRLGADRPWLGAVVILVPTAALLAATEYRHYGVGRAVSVAQPPGDVANHVHRTRGAPR